MKEADYQVENQGSIFLVLAMNPDALRNLQEKTNEEAQWWGPNGLVVEPRYVAPLVEQLREEGWVVE